MTFSQLLVLLEAQQLLSCAERDRDIQTQTSAEHVNQTEDSGRNCLIWNSLRASFPFQEVTAHFWPNHNWRACSQARFGTRLSLLSLLSPMVFLFKKQERVLLIFGGRGGTAYEVVSH